MAKQEQTAEGQAPAVGTEEQQEARTKDTEQLRADIEQTREELGDTVEALAEKTDVKSQAKAKADEAKERLAGKKDEFAQKARESTPESFDKDQAITYAKQNPVPVGIAAVILVFLLGRASKRR